VGGAAGASVVADAELPPEACADACPPESGALESVGADGAGGVAVRSVERLQPPAAKTNSATAAAAATERGPVAFSSDTSLCAHDVSRHP